MLLRRTKEKNRSRNLFVWMMRLTSILILTFYLGCEKSTEPLQNIFEPQDTEKYLVYIGEYPKNKKIGWAENVQGITHDDSHWYISQQRTLWRVPAQTVDLSRLTRSSTGVMVIDLERIPELWDLDYDHFGDLEYYEFRGKGFLLVPLEDDRREAPSAIAAFEAATLQYIDHAALGMKDAPWCAIDPLGVMYTSNTGKGEIARFKVNWQKLKDNGTLELTPSEPISLQDESGNPVIIDTPQGGAISPRGQLLYLVAGYQKGSHPSWGIHVFDLFTGKRISRSANGTGPFNYEFHPGFPKYEEPEGITIWDVEDGGIPGISGKMHVLMLDWDPGDDIIHFKHYTDITAYPVLYEHINYGGKPLPLRENIPNLVEKGFNDVASSIYIPDGWMVKLYEHVDFEGDSLILTESQANFHDNAWGDKVSSAIVLPPAE